MIIDCEQCAARPAACGDCVVGVLLGGEGARPPGAPILSLDAPEHHALDVLAEQGLVPRLRLLDTRTHQSRPDGRDPEADRHVG